ncbi:MAG: glycosyltransferase family 2 protein [Thermodesulfobacteriota bacterium]
MDGKPPAGFSVGAVVVNWNSGEYLGRCLKAMAEQEAAFTRVVVVDNGDDAAAGAWEGVWPRHFQRIALPRNVGFAKANNIALPHLSDCDWIALVNPDAFLKPDWLGRLLDAARRYPTIPVFAGCLVKALDPDRLDGAGDAFHFSGIAWRRGHGARRNTFPLTEMDVFGPCAAAALYRRDVLVEAGAFDEDFFCYFEDVDLAFRLRLMGRECRLIPAAVAGHVGSVTTGGQKSDFAVYHGHRNLVWCYVKNMPGLLFWLLLPAFLLMNAAAVARFILRGQGRVILHAKRDAIRGLPAMWRKRQVVQTRRTASAHAVWRSFDKGLRPRLK